MKPAMDGITEDGNEVVGVSALEVFGGSRGDSVSFGILFDGWYSGLELKPVCGGY